VHLAKHLLILSLTLVACNPAGTTAPSSSLKKSGAMEATSSRDRSADVTSKKDITSKKWDQLVRHELVWRRPELDRSCGPSHLGHFMRSVRNQATLAGEFGCILPEGHVTDVESQAEFLGNSYCCPRSRTAAMPHTAGLPTCERAVEEYRRAFRDSEPPPITSTADQYGAILNQGSYFQHCAIPETSGIEICAAVLDAQVVGLTVRVWPTAPSLADCVAAAVIQLTFPPSARMVVAQTWF
jgi:hypothetical protein